MKYEFWQHDPVPMWGVETHQGEAFDGLAEPFINLLLANEGGVTLRGVEIGRLPTILSSGIDVDPTHGIIYCEFGDKAYEYGGFPKVIMVFRYKNDAGRQVTLPVFRTVFPNSSPDSVAEARKLYPFQLGRDSAGREHRCRVQPESQAHANYLSACGYFIPGNPWDALTAVFVFGIREHLDAARAVVEAFGVPRTAMPQS
ncbi:MAG: hypothetical protein ACRDPJ_09055 [Nocardioidaceae bacterium]